MPAGVRGFISHFLLAAEPFAQAEKLREKRKRYQEVMDILNPPKEQAIEADVVQEQSREYPENDRPRKYKKRSKYSETETYFLSWANGSAPVGEIKCFSRFGKLHFYEKPRTAA